MVIPCFGGAALTRVCVESLLAQQGRHELEIVLVDNARDPATLELAGLDARVTVLPQAQNLGFAGGCNRGLAHAREPFVLVLNNDTRVAPNLLSRLQAAVLHDARVAFAAPISNRVKGPAMIACGEQGRTAEGCAEIERELCDPNLGRYEDVDSLSGLCLLGRAETFRQLGGFDERFVPGNFEDDDLCLRARLRGWRLVIARDAFVHHEAHQTFRAMGIDITAEIHRQHAVFRDKWQHHPAGLAVLRSLANDHAGAAMAAAAAHRLCPQWPDADWYVARDLAQQGHFDAAIPHLEALLEQCPLHKSALLLLGRCWLETGAPQRAQRLWRSTMQHCSVVASEGKDLLLHLGQRAQKAGDWERAAEHFAAALEFVPDDATLLNSLGAALVELRRFETAVPLLERAAAAGLALAHTNLGICHFHRGDAAVALEHFAAAAAKLPDDPTVQQNYTRALAASPKPN